MSDAPQARDPRRDRPDPDASADRIAATRDAPESALGRYLRASRNAFIALVPLLSAGLFGALLWHEVRKESIEIDRIDVPASLAEAGFTADVVARRLADHLERAAGPAKTEQAQRPGMRLAGTAPDLSVPIAGLSLRGLAALVRDVFGIQQQAVTGEVVLIDQKLAIRLRIAGFGEIANFDGFPPGGVDAMLARAAPEIWRAIRPRVYAWHVAATVPDQQEVRRRLGALRTVPDVAPATLDTVDYLTGRSLLRSRQHEQALALYRRMTRDRPDYAAGWAGLVAVLREMGRLAEAWEAQQHLGRIDGKTAWIMSETTLLLFLLNRSADALAAAEETLRLDPANAAGRVLRVEAMDGLERGAEAMVLIDGYLMEYPDRSDYWYLKSRIHATQRQWADALAAAERAIASTDQGWYNPSLFRWQKARVLNGMERYNEALAALNEGLGMSPPFLTGTRMRELRISVLMSQRRFGDAAAAADDLIARAPNVGTAWRIRGRALAAADRREDAVASYRKAVELAPDLPGLKRELERVTGAPSDAGRGGDSGGRVVSAPE